MKSDVEILIKIQELEDLQKNVGFSVQKKLDVAIRELKWVLE